MQGVRFERRGRIFEIVSREGTHVMTQELGSHVSQALTQETFLSEYLDGSLRLLVGHSTSMAAASSPSKQALERSLSDYPEKIQECVQFRKFWVDQYGKDGKVSLSQASLRSFLAGHASAATLQFPGQDLPSPSTVKRWVQAFEVSGGNILSLVPQHDRKGGIGGIRTKTDDIELILAEHLDQHWLTTNRPTLRFAYVQFRGALLTMQLAKTMIPSYATFCRRAQMVNHYDRVKAQEGRYAALKKARYVGPASPVSRPLERIQIDSTRLDVFLYDSETGIVLGRPFLIFAIDEFTRCTLGYYLTFESPSIESTMACLRHAILPKTPRAWFRDSEYFEWPMYGIPEQIVIDNGLEFKNSALEDAARQLGFDIILSPPYCPWFKGAVERHFRTFNQDVVHNLPGNTKGNIRERGELDPRDTAQLSFEEMIEEIERFVVTKYHLRLAAGQSQSPLQKWKASESKVPLCLPQSPTRLIILLSRVTEREATSAGIQYLFLRYNSAELYEIVQKHGGKVKVRVKVGVEDIRTVYVFSPLTKQYIVVGCVSNRYASYSSIPLQLHKAVLAEAKRRNVEITDAALVAIRAELANVEQQGRKTATSLSTAKRGKKKSQKVSFSSTGVARSESLARGSLHEGRKLANDALPESSEALESTSNHEESDATDDISELLYGVSKSNRGAS